MDLHRTSPSTSVYAQCVRANIWTKMKKNKRFQRQWKSECARFIKITLRLMHHNGRSIEEKMNDAGDKKKKTEITGEYDPFFFVLIKLEMTTVQQRQSSCLFALWRWTDGCQLYSYGIKIMRLQPKRRKVEKKRDRARHRDRCAERMWKNFYCCFNFLWSCVYDCVY